MPQPTYTKLTGRSRSLGGFTQLWLAPDHILLLKSTRFSEDYKRFSISDIQSIVVTELPPRMILQVLMIVASLAWTSLVFSVDSRAGKGFFVFTGSLALLWSIIDIARGPRCRGVLQTRVSRELLEPVNRMKTARRFLATIRPMIEAAQGVLPPQLLVETPSASYEPPPPEIVSTPGYLPEVVFVIFLVNAALIAASIHFPKVQEIPQMLLNTLGVETLLVIVALVRRRNRDPRLAIYVVLALALIGIGFDLLMLARELFGWFIALQEKARTADKSVVFLKLFPSTGYRATIAASWRAAAGVIGLATAFLERRRK